MDHQLRKEAWKYLLHYYPFEMTDIERMDLRDEREKAYWVMKQQWQTFTPDQESRFQKWREVKHLISEWGGGCGREGGGGGGGGYPPQLTSPPPPYSGFPPAKISRAVKKATPQSHTHSTLISMS